MERERISVRGSASLVPRRKSAKGGGGSVSRDRRPPKAPRDPPLMLPSKNRSELSRPPDPAPAGETCSGRHHPAVANGVHAASEDDESWAMQTHSVQARPVRAPLTPPSVFIRTKDGHGNGMWKARASLHCRVKASASTLPSREAWGSLSSTKDCGRQPRRRKPSTNRSARNRGSLQRSLNSFQVPLTHCAMLSESMRNMCMASEPLKDVPLAHAVLRARSKRHLEAA